MRLLLTRIDGKRRRSTRSVDQKSISHVTRSKCSNRWNRTMLILWTGEEVVVEEEFEVVRRAVLSRVDLLTAEMMLGWEYESR